MTIMPPERVRRIDRRLIRPSVEPPRLRSSRHTREHTSRESGVYWHHSRRPWETYPVVS